MMKKKTMVTLFLVAVAGFQLQTMAQQAGRPAALVEVDYVSYQQEEDVRRYTGRLVSPSTVMIVPRVSGEIQKVGFKDGTMVKKGDVLYQLDPVQYFAALKAAEARVEQCRAELVQCQAKEKYAKNNYDRNQSLFNKAVVSQDTLDSAVSAYDVTKAASAAAKANLHAAEANLLKAQDDYKNTKIVAPMDALAGVTAKTAGNYVTPSTGNLVSLIQTNPMRVRFALSYREFLDFLNDQGKVCVTPLIRIRLANGDFYEKNGTLELINNEANHNTDAIHLFANFENKKNILFHGGTVAVYLSFVKNEKKLAVLPSAVMHDANGAYVYVVGANNSVERRNVTLGRLNANWQIVEKGLKENEMVVVDGMNKTMPGATIQPQMRQSAKR